MKNRFRLIPLYATLALGSIAAMAEDFEQRGTHEHGKVAINIAIDGNIFSAEVTAPAINVVGFERAPKDATEKKMAADAEKWLTSGRNAFGVSPAAKCLLKSTQVTTPTWAEHDHDHDHKHDHDHDHAHEGEDHADYRARMTYECSNVAAIDAVELWLLKRLPGTTEATVNIVAPGVQTSTTATPASPRVALR
jgi:hypothetical protein